MRLLLACRTRLDALGAEGVVNGCMPWRARRNSTVCLRSVRGGREGYQLFDPPPLFARRSASIIADQVASTAHTL